MAFHATLLALALLDREYLVDQGLQDCSSDLTASGCVVTLVDRLIRRAEVIEIDAESYRLKEAKELNGARVKQRRSRKS